MVFSVFRLQAVVALVLLGPAQAGAFVIWDESIHGDLSNDHLHPTPFLLDLGVSSLIATSGVDPDTGDMDRELFTLTIPAGALLTEVRLAAYVSDDPRGFIGVVSGPVMMDPENPVIDDLLGWSHFGPSELPVGSDYLPRIGQGFGAIGFTPPLPAGDYSWWVQQLAPTVTYQWDFIVTPEPASLAPLSLGSFVALRRRR